MVQAQYRLVTEHLKIPHLKLVIGQSMGGMHAWMWGEMYPDFVSALVPMAAQPVQMSGRNWMLRRMLVEHHPRRSRLRQRQLQGAARKSQACRDFFQLGDQRWHPELQKQAPTREQADKVVEARLAQRFSADANDYIYSYEAARDYDPSPDLEKITARVLAINAADDERNPAELGILDREIKRVKNGRMYLIPASAETRGHGTTGDAKFWKHLLPPLLSDATLAGQ